MSSSTITTTQTEAALKSIQTLRERVNVSEMLDRPFFKYIEENELTAEQHREFFSQYYSIVKISYKMLAAGILSTPPEDTNTIEHLVKFLETESGGHPNHLGHYIRWAEHFGVSAEDLAAVKPNAKSQEFEDTLMGFFSSRDGLEKQAAQLGLEDCAEVLIDGLDRGYRRYPMSARVYGYLMVHKLLENDEEGHSRWAMDSLAESKELKSRMGEVERVYRRVYEIFDGVFQGTYEAWEEAKARA